jgi:acyl dehydratase
MGAMQVALFDPELGLDWNKVVHGEQSFEYKKPVQVGDELSFISTIEDIKTKVGNDFITIRSDVKDSNKNDVATLRATLIARGTG